jgi:hypothetical protein
VIFFKVIAREAKQDHGNRLRLPLTLRILAMTDLSDSYRKNRSIQLSVIIKFEDAKDKIMCSDNKPDLREFLDNLKKPMPLSKKARLYLRNNLLKIRRLRSCCGNYGEPGC